MAPECYRKIESSCRKSKAAGGQNRTAGGSRWAGDGRMASSGIGDPPAMSRGAAATHAAAPPATAAGSVVSRARERLLLSCRGHVCGLADEDCHSGKREAAAGVVDHVNLAGI